MEAVNKIHSENKALIDQIMNNCGFDALNDSFLAAVFVAAHLKLVETTPEELKEIDDTMKTLVNTGFADGSMGCTMSEDDINELL